MSSRLDRLFLLLDQASTVSTRRAAALQLGEVQRLHPHELNNLLAKVRHYLQSSSWDTRIAASIAVEAIVKQVPLWLPQGQANGSCIVENSVGRISFEQFDINAVIECGKDLLASEGTEFDSTVVGEESMDFKEKLVIQRELLNQRLGLHISQHLDFGFNSNDIISNEDLSVCPQNNKTTEVCDENVQKPQAIKRNISSNELFVKKPKIENPEAVEATADVTDFSCSEEWPLESFTDLLINDLFNPNWEVRHGASTALREIVKHHGRCGGRVVNVPQQLMDKLNQAWLEDLALRLFCVLALDKFGDFVSDQVVAPVRETCAQTLGSIFGIMCEEKINFCVQILLKLLTRREWEARHGGLLGLKYLLAVRQDLTPVLLPVVFDPIFQDLNDPVDDVSAVAASALIPVKDSVIETLPDKVPIVIDFLWNALLDIDDLTSSTSNILTLLSSLLNGSQSSNQLNLKVLMPRLWPFLGHHLFSVRKSVLDALITLTSNDLSFLDTKLLSDSLRLLYQRCLIEPKEEILSLLYNAWEQLVRRSSPRDLLVTTFQYFSGWVCLMMHPSKIAIDCNTSPVWLEVKHIDQNSSKNRKADVHSSESEKYFLGGSDSVAESQSERDRCVVRARLQAAKFMGLLACYVTKVVSTENPTPVECLSNILLFHLNSKSATQKTCVAWIITEWSLAQRKESGSTTLPSIIVDKCLDCLQENPFYDEMASSFTRLQYDTRDFVSLLKQHKFKIDENVYKFGAVYTFQQISDLVNDNSLDLSKCKVRTKNSVSLEEKRRSLIRLYDEVVNLQTNMSTSVLASLASALVSWDYLPDKLNPIVRPLMDSIKREENEQLQKCSAIYITKLIDLCTQKPRLETSPSPVSKILKNLVTFLCSNDTFTLNVNTSSLTQRILTKGGGGGGGSSSGSSSPITPATLSGDTYGIVTLLNMRKNSEKLLQMRRSNSINFTKKNHETNDESNAESKEEVDRSSEITKRGATFALCEIARYFEDNVRTRLPQLWERITFVSKVVGELEELSEEKVRELLQSLQIIETTAPFFHKNLHCYLKDLLPALCSLLGSAFNSIRHMASRCLGVLSVVVTQETLSRIVEDVLNLLGATDSDVKRQGAVEAIYCVIEKLRISIVPYIVLLIVPMLGRMSDQNEQVRVLATHCFAQLIQLMPLDNVTSSNLKPEILARKKEEQHFLEQLMNPKKSDDYKIQVPINAELRSYQHEGVNWLAFLNKYKLHGILCDEMGLGKTLMSLCILASDHYNRANKYKETKSDDCKPLPSLVICPPTLTGHWVYEVEKFVESSYLKPLNYSGPPTERARLRSKLKRQNSQKTYNLIIASYDIVRNDIDFFSSVVWNYCILDEGHIIKNGKTKLSKAIKSLTSNHRVILTGTPIQNNVLELWSLFDFLMPGFLGTERQFMARYSKPILQSRDAKSSSKEQEAGVLAMESLHRQVLPFILRRMKEDVLKDLPPKIIQDYYCDLSPLQARLYEDFSKSHVKQSLENSLSKSCEGSAGNTSNIMSTHIFQALQYLRKVCNHPKLVLTPQHPEYCGVISTLKEQNSSLSDITHAAKLCALKQLLLDCGIGCHTSESVINESEPVVNQHRALIFCQLKGMLDILENDLFKSNMPSVAYLRLDGSVPPSSRHSVVHRFNNDPSIDVLLLTTQVGGLGLNLTGADTVIFVEHDWNPMKDLQAMDRAHRIGQKKVVNVYRLITTGTLEEKIMGLQKFKLTIANTVISDDNSCLSTMRTDQLLDLFSLNAKEGGNQQLESKSSGVKSILENLPELWDTNQYDEEYDLSNFIKSLKS